MIRQRLTSLKGALLIPFVVLILAVAGVIGALSYRTGADALDELAKHRADDILSRIELATDLHIQDSQLVLGTLKANHASGALDMEHLPSIENHLWQIAGLTESIGYVFFANPRGDFVGVERFPDGRVNVRVRDSTTDGIRHSYLARKPGDRDRIIFNQSGAYDPRTRPWYKLAVEQKKGVWSEIYVSDARGILKMTRAMPLYVKDQLIGVIGTDVTLTHLSSFLRSLTISKNGVAFICDSKGALVAVSTGEAPSVKVGGEEQRVAASASPNAVIRLAAGEMARQHAGELRTTSATSGGGVLIAAKPFGQSGLDWSLAVAIPRADILAGVTHGLTTTLAICLLAALMAVAIGFALLKWVNRGLDQLVTAADGLSHESWDQKLPFTHSQELNKLATAFDTMALRLRGAINTVANQNVQLEEVNRTLEARVEERSQHISKLSKLVEQTDDGFLVTNATGTITYVNPAWEHITGYSFAEAVGKTPQLVKSDQHDHEFHATVWKLLKAGQAWRGIYTNRRKDGEQYFAETTITPVRNPAGEIVEFVSVEKDVTERERLRQEINYLAHFDSLTALANRSTLMNRLQRALQQGSRHYDTGQCSAILYMDLDRFKPINDQYGHETGDAVLAEVGRRLRLCVRDGDTIARVGGDEFVALLPDLRDPANADLVADKIRASLAEPFSVRDLQFRIGVSIGIAIAPRDGKEAEGLLRHADQEMYRAKGRQPPVAPLVATSAAAPNAAATPAIR